MTPILVLSQSMIKLQTLPTDLVAAPMIHLSSAVGLFLLGTSGAVMEKTQYCGCLSAFIALETNYLDFSANN